MSASAKLIACCGASAPVCVDDEPDAGALGCCVTGAAACGCDAGTCAVEAEDQPHPARAAVSTATAGPCKIRALDIGQS